MWIKAARIYCLGSILLCVMLAGSASGMILDSDNPNLDENGHIPVADMPPVGLRPADDYAVGIGLTDLNGYSLPSISAVPVAPNFVISAAHWSAPWVADPTHLNARVYVGRDQQPSFEVLEAVALGSNSDIVLMKIAPLSPSGPAGLSHWVNPYDAIETPGMPVAIGTYYWQQKRYIGDPQNPQLIGNSVVAHQLTWGRNRIGPITGNLNIVQDSPSSPNYLPYEAVLYGEVGDSGSGWYLKDGWEWKIDGTTLSPTSTAMNFGNPAMRQLLANGILAMGGTLPGLSPAAALPAPTKVVQSSFGNWQDSTTWNPSGAPTGADIVRVTNGVLVNGSSPSAQQVFVGASGQMGTVIQSPGSTLNVVDSVYLGPQAGDFGQYIANGTLNAESVYVGVYGSGDLRAYMGNANVHLLTVGTKAGSSGAVVWESHVPAMTLHCDAIVLGRDSGSTGNFSAYAYSSATIAAKLLVVGERGAGTFTQQGGQSSVTADRLVVGDQPGSTGTYEISSADASLQTSDTVVGNAGAGTLKQVAGTHVTDRLHVGAGGVYELSGGTLTVVQSTEVSGTMKLGGGTWNLSQGITDLGQATISGPWSTTTSLPANSLLIVPAGMQVPNVAIPASSVLHHEGDTLVVGQGKLISGSGTIRDNIEVRDNGTLQGALDFRANLTLDDTGTVFLQEPITVLGSQVFDVRSGTFSVPVVQVGNLVTPGHLTAKGRIQTINVGMTPASVLEIGPGVGSLQIDGALYQSGATLKMDVGGLNVIDSDHLTVDTSIFSGNLQLHLVNGFVPRSGDQVSLITYLPNPVQGSFNNIIIDGPGALAASGTFNNAAHQFSVTFHWDADLDDDGHVNASDIDRLWHIVRGTEPNDPNDDEDFNGDGVLNEDDVDFMLAHLMDAGTGFHYGDADLQGGVGPDDFTAWRLGESPVGWAHGDWDGDGSVGPDDFTLWRTAPTQYPFEVGPRSSFGGGLVPEPASIVLMGIGLVGWAGWHLRSRCVARHARLQNRSIGLGR